MMLCAAAPRPFQHCLRAIAALLVALGPLTAGTRPLLAQSGEVVVKSPQAILMDADSGGILFQRNADELVPPASMSKLMLLIMIFNALRAGEITPDTEVIMSEYAWRTGGAPSRTSAMFVPLGKTAKVSEMLQGIIVQSGNDASIAMAEMLGGSEQKFAEAMTEQARHLGLRKSVFRNATGLYHPEHLSTMRELAQLARIIIRDYPEYYPLFAQREFGYRQHKFYNRNPLLGAVPGVDGLKTGYVKESGYSIIASAKVDNRRLIMVIGARPRPKIARTTVAVFWNGGSRTSRKRACSNPVKSWAMPACGVESGCTCL
ncbi:MAG: D-alanyl-D-alanine carboxypeptidase [Sphingomonadales bacterium]|nr:D-alanyl-D-alanine carboxypeptidase [Sphingomonadales bacterium]